MSFELFAYRQQGAEWIINWTYKDYVELLLTGELRKEATVIGKKPECPQPIVIREGDTQPLFKEEAKIYFEELENKKQKKQKKEEAKIYQDILNRIKHLL